jgi:hypothetical protein
MPSVEALTVGGVQLLQLPRNRMFSRNEEQVIVVRQKTVRNAADAEPHECDGEQLEKRSVVFVVGEDVRFLIAAFVHVVQEARRMQAQRSAHGPPSGKTLARGRRCQSRGIQRSGATTIAERAIRPLVERVGFFRRQLTQKEDKRARNKI